VYILLNKPPEVVSAMADPEGRKTLRNFLRGLPERVFPVGNLEYAASGLVFLTNDGDLAAEMLKNWARLEQAYHVKVKGMLTLPTWSDWEKKLAYECKRCGSRTHRGGARRISGMKCACGIRKRKRCGACWSRSSIPWRS